MQKGSVVAIIYVSNYAVRENIARQGVLQVHEREKTIELSSFHSKFTQTFRINFFQVITAK